MEARTGQAERLRAAAIETRAQWLQDDIPDYHPAIPAIRKAAEADVDWWLERGWMLIPAEELEALETKLRKMALEAVTSEGQWIERTGEQQAAIQRLQRLLREAEVRIQALEAKLPRLDVESPTSTVLARHQAILASLAQGGGDE